MWVGNMIFCWQVAQKCFHLRSFDPAHYPGASPSPYLIDDACQADDCGRQRRSAARHGKDATLVPLALPRFGGLVRDGLGTVGVGGEVSGSLTEADVDLVMDVT